MEKQHLKISNKNYAPVSWQLEFLIAGGIIFSLYTSTDYFKHLFLLKYPISNFDYAQVLLFFGTYVLTRVLLIGFGLNLILRTVWLAYYAISYWYPDDVNYEKLKLNFYQKKHHQTQANAKERLLILDKWANLSFSITIIFTFIVFSSIIVLLFIQFILAEVLGAYWLINNAIFNYASAIIVLLLQLGIFDFIIKKKHQRGAFFKIGDILYKIYYYGSGLFFYRRELLVLRTNGKNWLLLSFGTGYLLLALFISINQIGEFYEAGTFNVNLFDDRITFNESKNYIIDYRTYEDQLGMEEVFFNGGIQSQYIKDNYLKVFVVHHRKHDWYLKYVRDSLNLTTYNPPKSDSLRKLYNEERARLDQQSLNRLLKVEIDGHEYKNLNWDRYKHFKTKEQGYLTYIMIDTLKKGRHQINTYTRNRYTGDVKLSYSFSVPFFVD
ncbi:hypothetical protein BST92_13440 [Nonlabens arenilitoris]|uniref:Uncharacterized protein n=1 Tax=Nonlabens arenilitoris TaxID=1217969 RepID=A0A2S7UE16_9FLAO|nr:hypothetical protein [Nonlabens arenilitoris]PQJ32860.1 hypothetical protein BST92_13440 [Nonlabens arenilitoris]